MSLGAVFAGDYFIRIRELLVRKLCFSKNRTDRALDLCHISLVARGKLLECRADNNKGSNVRSSFQEFFQDLQRLWITRGVVGLRVLFLIPKANCHDFSASGSTYRVLIMKAFLLSRPGVILFFISVRK